MSELDTIKTFLNIKRFAMVGVSRAANEFSRKLFREFLLRGYDVIPVNPHARVIEGRNCFPCLKDLEPQVSSALLMTPRRSTDDLLFECADAGIAVVWIYGTSGKLTISPNIERICEETGMKIIPGFCPLMFLPGVSLPHRVHTSLWKLFGMYPS